MRHYRNHPSVVMWVAGMNFFNNAVDADPRHMGRHGWDQSNERWQRLMVAGKEMFDGLKKLDPTRVYYSHAGAYTGDVYTMNCYLDLIPLQEREDWLSAWADSGEMPISMVEFGTPMDCTFRRGTRRFHQQYHQRAAADGVRRHLLRHGGLYLGGAQVPAVSSRPVPRRHALRAAPRTAWTITPTIHKIQQLFRIEHLAQLADRGSAGRPAHLVLDAGRAQGDQRPDPGVDRRPGRGVHRQGPPLQPRPEDREADRPDQRHAPAPGFHRHLDRHGRRQGRWAGARLHGSLAVSEIRFIPFQVIAPAVGRRRQGRRPDHADRGHRREPSTRTPLPFACFGEDPPASGEIAVVDPNGMTGKMLTNLGYHDPSLEWRGRAPGGDRTQRLEGRRVGGRQAGALCAGWRPGPDLCPGPGVDGARPLGGGCARR